MACRGVVWNLPPAPAEVMEKKARELLAAAEEAAAQGQPVPYFLLAGPWKDRDLLLRRLLVPLSVATCLALTLVVAEVAGVGPGGTALLLAMVVAFWGVLDDWRGLPWEPSPPPCLFRPRYPVRLSPPRRITLPPLHTTPSCVSWRAPRPERARQGFLPTSRPRWVPPLRLSPARPRPMPSNPFSLDRLHVAPVSPAPFYSAPFSPTYLNPFPYFPTPMHPLHFSPFPFSPVPFPPTHPNPLHVPPASFPPGPTSTTQVSSTLIHPARNPPATVSRKRTHEDEDQTPPPIAPKKIRARNSASRKRRDKGRPVAPGPFTFGGSKWTPPAVPASGEEPMDCTPAP